MQQQPLPVVVGVDIGTSAVKVMAIDTAGRTIAEGSESYDLKTPRPGWVEVDANDVYAASLGTLKRVLNTTYARGVAPSAIGFSVAMHSIIPVDAGGDPIGPMINWMDRRSGSIAEAWREDGTAQALYERTGAPMHPMLPLCKLNWLAENDRATFDRAARFVSIKELLIHRWTGEWLVDHAIASATGMFDLRTRDWDPTALELARVTPERLSKPASTKTALNGMGKGAAKSLGLPDETEIVLCSSDGALANLGVGAATPDRLALTLGTSGAIRVVLGDPALDAQGRTFCYCFDDTHYLVGGPTSSAGAVLNWLFALLTPEIERDKRFTNAVALAEKIPPGAEGVTFLPFLSGERAPYWMSGLRGNIIGLDLAHDRRHILRAAFEGVVCALYSVYEVLRERVGNPSQILLSGGLTHSPLVRHLIANIFGSEVAQPNQLEASCFGAAMMAALAIGLLEGPDDVAKLLTYSEIMQPDPGEQERYAEIYARYRECVGAVLPLFK